MTLQGRVFPSTVRVQCPGHVERFKAVVRLDPELLIFIECPTCARRYYPEVRDTGVHWSAGDRDLKFLDLVPEFLG
jgi:hypothetical protein